MLDTDPSSPAPRVELCGELRCGPRIFVDPVGFSGLASVVLKCLLRLRRVGRDAPDGKSHEDGFAVDRFLIVEVAATVLELTYTGNTAQRAAFRCREIDIPLMRRGVVPAQRR